MDIVNPAKKSTGNQLEVVNLQLTYRDVAEMGIMNQCSVTDKTVGVLNHKEPRLMAQEPGDLRPVHLVSKAALDL